MLKPDPVIHKDPKTELIRSLLGRNADAVEALMGKKPDEVVGVNDHKILKYREGDVREIHLDASGRVIRCGYTEERRTTFRVFSAHFISITVIGSNGEDYQGMVLDMSNCSMKIRGKQPPFFGEGVKVQLEFVIPEGTNKFPIVIADATAYRIRLRDEVYQVVFKFDPPGGEEHAYIRYVRCRESEAVFGVKWCEKCGSKCKNGLFLTSSPPVNGQGFQRLCLTTLPTECL